MNTYLPGYYFCLNKLVSFKHNVNNLSSLKQLLDFSKRLEVYYEDWKNKATKDPERCAKAYSGLGGVYLARFHIQPDFVSKYEALSKAIEYHTKAMELRRSNSSPKLYLSHTALGTDYFHTGCLYLTNKETACTQNALAAFRAAADQHHQAVQLAENPEKHVSWTRMAGCWYKLYLNTPESMTLEREEYRKKIAAAVASSYNCLKASSAKGGVIHLSSEIYALLRDISRYMPLLSLTETDKTHIDQLCDLYHQAFPDRPKPMRSPDGGKIIF
jgi:hypothetical protein